MPTNKQVILSVNAGSSSLKLAVYEAESLEKLASCQTEGINQQKGLITFSYRGDKSSEDKQFSSHSQALQKAIEIIFEKLGNIKVIGAGHRIVFTGPMDSSAQKIDEKYLQKYKSLEEIDPDHTPFVAEVIEKLRTDFPEIAHVACADSFFFKGLPEVASMLPLPRKYFDQGIKKYGYHGLSYTYLMSKLTKDHPNIAKGKVILAHLGSGASLAAVENGQPVDTTMSFSPTSGIPMSSRSGDLDPSVVTYLMKQEKLSPEEFNHIVNHESGILGISGTTADMRKLLKNESSDEHAAQAIEVFCYRISQAIGALAASMNGVDGLIFTGGIGERSVRIRELIYTRLEHLNITSVLVIPTDEEIIIAKQTKKFIS